MVLPLASLDELSIALERSFTLPILIFKHSSRCGTSAMASEEVHDLLDGAPFGADVYLIHIQAHRALSDEVARRLGVRHESPQVLLVQDGIVRWHASHFRVTADGIRRVVDSLSRSTEPAAPTSPL